MDDYEHMDTKGALYRVSPLAEKHGLGDGQVGTSTYHSDMCKAFTGQLHEICYTTLG
jgi:hypothetical protein